ncbi:DMT family transporter [Falsiroseomonas oryziterrae]|uniref:DMT family transporter n=1 Tax=Falsiroseomonas oryziterrae TaxID=2911368 RepID=UPI001F3F7CBE|nr:DMT family transporter [Roseomonas sp. NPKOSM-4]
MKDDNLRGAALMSAAAVIFAAEALAIRWMTARGIPTEMQIAARAGGQLLWTLPAILATGAIVFRTQRAGLHVLRGVASLLTWGGYYASFARLDAATATVLSFTNVVFTTLMAGPVLGERVDRWRWAGALAGLVGIAVMLRPGGGVDVLGAALAIGAAIAWCGITLTSRRLTRTESTATILAWVGLITFAGSAPFAVLAWQSLSLADWAILLAVASVSPAIIWLVTEALRAGEASAIAPFQYLRLVFVAAAAWLFWGEAPDAWGWLGAAIIVGGAIVVTVAEARRR